MTEPELLGITAAHELLGISRQGIDWLAKRGKFPKPVHTLPTGRLWARADLEKWAQETGRTLKTS
jgi:predicted DNA-binding transcriptional regulator AlpA